MDEKVKELLKYYAQSKYSVISEFSDNFSEDRKALYNEVKSYCKDFNIAFDDNLFPENMIEMMLIDKEQY